MSQNTSPDYVPSAKKGEVDSVAAPGLVGVGGTNSAINFDAGNGFVSALFPSSFTFLRGNAGERLHSLVVLAPNLTTRCFRRGAFLPTHAVSPVGWPDIDGCASLARLIAIRIPAPVYGLSGYGGSRANEHGQDRSLQHGELPFSILGSFA